LLKSKNILLKEANFMKNTKKPEENKRMQEAEIYSEGQVLNKFCNKFLICETPDRGPMK
jgi:hypothetical protein